MGQVQHLSPHFRPSPSPSVIEAGLWLRNPAITNPELADPKGFAGEVR
jgi:hypothetical protein